jgi:nucleotide-binding universal stress UspA family protein
MSGVVIGTDGTVHCDEALRFAAREARMRGTELVVVMGYVGPIDPDVDDFETPKAVQILRHEVEATGAIIRALSLPAGTLPRYRVVSDSLEPSALILRTVAALDAELIVIGQRRRHLLSRLVHGPSRVSKLIRRSRVPVVVVPEPDHASGDIERDERAAGRH